MKIAIIGRTEILYETACQLHASGHEIVCILTAKEAPEYTRGAEDFRQLAEQWRIPYASSAKIIDHRDFLAASGADIAVSINYSGVIPKVVTDLFPLGILNAHGGDLPRYRGNACQAWAIINGEERIALCIHRMVGGELDSGDIIARIYLSINIATKIGEVMDWIIEKTPHLFQEALKKLELNPEYILEEQSKNPQDALRCYPRTPDDGKINWDKSNKEIIRLINASGTPFSGAFCYFEDRKITVLDAEVVVDKEKYCAVPGQVTRIGGNFIEVACGLGKIKINTINIENEITSPVKIINSLRKRLR